MNILNIVSIICFALCLIMFFYLRWYIKKRTSFNTGLEDRHEEVLKLIAEIDRITDRDSRLVEERIKALKEILEEADSRVALYVKEFEKRQTGEALYTSLSRGIRAALDVPSSLPAPQAQKQDTIEISQAAAAQRSIEADMYLQQTRAGQVPANSQQARGARLPAPVPEYAANQNEKISKKQIRAHIDILVGEGRDAEEIASLLGISIAEVNLALNLRDLQRNSQRKAKSN